MASSVGEQCTALNLSDERRCQELATSSNGLFCAFHSKQVQGLYRGYKRRNAHLDNLSASPPQYLADSKTPLANQLFADIESEEVCQEIHDHLFRKFQLLERVIRARKLHHIHFFSMSCDYGHAKYLDNLQNERVVVNRALERIERRTAEILYKKQKWFKWVRQCQDEEEAHRDREQKKVKQEAALFRRHWKEVQQRMKELRAKEEQKMQDAFLEKAYKERLEQQTEEEDDSEDDSDWDPIEDVLEDQRGRFIDLIKHFLWMATTEEVIGGDSVDATIDKNDRNESTKPVANHDGPSQVGNSHGFTDDRKPTSIESVESPQENGMGNSTENKEPSSSKKSKSSKNKKKKTAKLSPTSSTQASGSSNSQSASASNEKEQLALAKSSKSSKAVNKNMAQSSNQQFDKNLIETREEMYERLKNGSEYNLDEVVGVMVAGTIENPVVATKTITYDEDEIERLLSEITEIKHLLFCRLLLGHAALLPAALRADSVEAFLNDPEVTESALRDLCLKMERPGLQEIRDACADLFRSEDEDVSDERANSESVAKDLGDMEDNLDVSEDDDMMILKPKKPKGALPDKWLSKREKARNKMPDMPSREEILGGSGEGTIVDFGEIRDGKFQKKMIRVKICGRTIWNYPSNKAMTRKGWLHFCIIAKDSSLYDAIALCRHWDEFFDLNILAVWHYFPGANWLNWVGNRWRQQMLQLGFIMYFESAEPDAMDLTQRHQTGRGGPYRRSYSVLEARNFICAHIKRDDPVSRRLIQYLHMQSHCLLMLVRDAETGRIVVKPPEEERWLIRQKSGLGRAVRGEWNIIRKVGPQFFEEMDSYRKWNFGFKEYYDIVLWDLAAGESFPALYNMVQETLFKAHRFCTGADLYNPGAHILKTITRDKDTHRVRDLKPGDDAVPSIYDDIHHEGTSFFYGKLETLNSHEVKRDPDQSKIPRRLFYTEADALEDKILFPDENSSGGKEVLAVEKLKRWEEEGFSLMKFVEGWWTDSDEDTSEDESEDEEDESDDQDVDDEGEEDCEDDDGKGILGNSIQAGDSADNSSEPAASVPEPFKELMDLLGSDIERREPREPDMEEQFMDFLDREKARVFKEVWHKADLEPHAQTRYIEMKEMASKSRKFNQRDLKNPVCLLTFKLLRWLEAFDDDARDLHKAIGKLSPFFFPDFLDSEEGAGFKESLLFNQEERAKHLPDIRSSVSNAYRPKEFWKEWDNTKKDLEALEDTPASWDVAVRPIIAHLYKSGVIRNRADGYFAGQAIAGQESHRNSWDLFIDWRGMIPTIKMPSTMQDPFSIPPFLTTARKFSAENPNARFAVLRLWSAPHFYPLMIGFNNQDGTSFRDLTGRMFIWMFVPKDMPKSEWSMHHTARQRTQPFAKLLGNKVVVKRNAFLVMGKDEEELRSLAMATTYAIQRKPWRWELDLWKSFVNVDLAFLEDLDSQWLE